MANIKSAKKRIDTTKRNTEYNKSKTSEMKTEVKKVRKAVAASDEKSAKTLLINASSVLDKNVTRGVIHKNKANRQKAKLAKAVNNIK